MSLLTKFLLGDLFKAAHGRYADTAKNRRLHRVGQEYGHAAKEKVPGSGRKPAQQDDEQKNPLAEKLDTLSPTQLSKLVDVSEKKLKEFKDKGYEQGAKKLEEIAREARKRLMGDEGYEKKDLVQRVKNTVSDKKDAGTVEQEWEDRIRDYIAEHYPTQANVTAETNSEKGREERERMKKDPKLKRMLEQQDREFEEADKKQESTEKKSPLIEARERNKQADRDAYIAELEYAYDEDLKDELKVLKRRLQNYPKNSRYPEGSKKYQAAIDEFNFQINAITEELQKRGVKVKPDGKKPVEEPKTEEKPIESEGKDTDDVKVEARMIFDDTPNSGKVKMAKYLSGARKNKVDSDFKAIKGLDDATVQTLHDGLVKKFNDEFDDMRKADRAEALYKIAKVKNELQKRFNASLTMG